MRKAVILPFMIIMAIVIGGALYLYGGAAFHPGTPNISGTNPSPASGTQSPAPGKGSTEFSVIAEGQNAVAVDQRVNYRITDADQLAQLWQMIYGNTGKAVPIIDFSHDEVLAVFDGSHSSGGYSITIPSVIDKSGQRTIAIVHTEPGDSCVTTESGTSPFEVIQIQKSSVQLIHDESFQTKECK